MKLFRNRCASHRESVCLRISGMLSEADARALESHLADCASCRQYFREVELAAAPLIGWEKSFAQIRPDEAARQRWAQAIEKAAAPLSPARGRTDVAAKLWSELIWPARRIWAGFATVWLLIAGFHLAQPDPATPSAAHAKPVSPDLLTAWLEQRQQWLELTGADRVSAPKVEKPNEAPPKPRSESRTSLRSC